MRERAPAPVGPMRLTAPDLACLTADSPQRPLDYAVILHFDRGEADPFSLDDLRRGAEEARRAYPVAASRIRGSRWIPFARPPGAVACWRLPGEETRPLIRDYLASGFRLGEEPPLRQLLLESGDPPRWSLVTRVHHAASDLTGALLFVGRQLAAALGGAPEAEPQQGPPALHQHRRGRRDPGSQEPSTPLAVAAGPPSPEREWMRFTVDRTPFSEVSWHFDGFTWNDVLLAAAMSALADWNRSRRASAARIGLWVPMNVRRNRFAGFGNGASRIRVHRQRAPGGTPKERFNQQLRLIRQEVLRARVEGEWALPSGPFTRLLLRAAPSVARKWLDRSGADYGTAGFAHLERWPGDREPAFGAVSDLEVVSCLHERHPLYFTALSRPEVTEVTITWDPALLSADDVATIGAGFRRAAALARP